MYITRRSYDAIDVFSQSILGLCLNTKSLRVPAKTQAPLNPSLTVCTILKTFLTRAGIRLDMHLVKYNHLSFQENI